MTKRYRKYRFINSIRLIVSVMLLLLAIFTLGFKAYTSTKEGNERARQMRAKYVEEQRRLLKFEVHRVAKLIDYEVDKHLSNAQNLAKKKGFRSILYR